MKDKWAQQFQEKMDGYEMAAPEMEWANIDKALAKNRRPHMGLIWGRRIAVAAAVGMMVIGGARVLLQGLEAGGEDAPQQNCGERWLTLRQERTAGKEGRLAGKEGRLLAVADAVNDVEEMETVWHERAFLSKSGGTDNKLPKSDGTDNKLPKSGGTDNNINNKDINGEIRTSRSVDGQKRGSENNNKSRIEKYYNPGSEKNNNRRYYHGGELIAAVYMQNTMTTNGTIGMAKQMNATTVSNTPYGSVSDEFRSGSLDFLAESNPKDIRYDHNRPIKVGISVRYDIDNRWSISSGLTYSYLRSSFDYSEGKAFGSGVQKLHYVGLPLAVDYNIISAKKLKVYLSAGGEVQKLVCGKATMDGVNIPEADANHDIKEGGMQWSLNAAIGAEYNFVDNFGIYIEPGVSHYIDNHSKVDNYYKYKPTNFSLNVGLRLSIR
ncbi:MAG: PorT family protein [Prevotella sp.]|nr:PorT family protein [Prevotella sp.]